MNAKNHIQNAAELITAPEIVKLMREAGTLEDIQRAAAIAREYCKQNNTPAMREDWHTLNALAAVYQAGRIQGIREERANRNRDNIAG